MNSKNTYNRAKVFALAFIISSFFFMGCNKPVNKSSDSSTPSGELLADTIIYSVVVKNPNSSDTWTEKCLSKLDHQLMTDKIFDAIYEYKATPYSYHNDQVLSIRDIKELESQEEFQRNKVGKLQFWESWYFNEETHQMSKKVHSILVAYELLAEDSTLRGYKAGFYIKLNN